MKTFRIQQEITRTDFITTDFMDVWNALEKSTDGEPLTITPKEMTVPEYEKEVKLIAALNLSIKTPWNGNT